MLHLGDITKINGADVPPVNVVIGGSPCQDLSVAGNRAGLSGERSGLFIEQLRIIKEMRRKDIENGAVITRPRYMVWENVPGAFSSNKGRDFKTVLEGTIGVVTEVKPDIPIPKEGWHYSGCIMGEGFSLAWRVFDAQFWGVPQRRRRIALVADFGGESAPEILFERKGVSGNITQSATPWKGFATAIAKRFGSANQTERGTDPADSENTQLIYDARGNGDGNISPTITGDHKNRVSDYTALCIRERCGCEGGGKGCLIQNEKSGTLAANNDQFTVCIGNGQADQLKPSEKAGTLNCMHDQQAVMAFAQNQVGEVRVSSMSGTLNTNSNATGRNSPLVYDARGNGDGKAVMVSAVRRLTPLEAERLQGFPDGWTDIGDYIDTNGKKRKTSDTARYKALGNSIALPPWAWLLERLSRYSEGDYTMASLFDGIGGFPLIWETLNGEGTCLWASEIDEFPIAVTKRHFS